MADISRKAQQNISEDKTKVELSEGELEGLSEDQINKLTKVEGKEGYRYVSMQFFYEKQLTNILQELINYYRM